MAQRGAVDDCQKFAWRLSEAYPVTRALPEISRGREEKNDKTRRVADFTCVRADGDFPGKMGRMREDRGPTLATRKIQNF